MRILVAPASFKGSLTAVRAAEIISSALEKQRPDIAAEQLPLADGGEGTVEALSLAWSGRPRSSGVAGPLGTQVQAHWAMAGGTESGSGSAALLCAASVAGLSILEPSERNPFRTSSFGLGELLRISVEEKARAVYIGLGDTSTNDCGLGMACALGFKVVMKNGSEMTRKDLFSTSLPQLLEDIERIEATDEMKTLNNAKYIVLADVSNPLYGSDGATKVFAAQKGLKKTDIPALETAVRRFAEIVRRDIRDVDPLLPGAGAAGGLGFALKALLGAELRPGAEFILKSVLFEEKAKLAAAVITGEGRIDAQTARGKVVAAVSAACSRIGIPCFALAGTVDCDPRVMAASLGLQKIVVATRSDAPDSEKIAMASENLHQAALRLLENLPIS